MKYFHHTKQISQKAPINITKLLDFGYLPSIDRGDKVFDFNMSEFLPWGELQFNFGKLMLLRNYYPDVIFRFPKGFAMFQLRNPKIPAWQILKYLDPSKICVSNAFLYAMCNGEIDPLDFNTIMKNSGSEIFQIHMYSNGLDKNSVNNLKFDLGSNPNLDTISTELDVNRFILPNGAKIISSDIVSDDIVPGYIRHVVGK